MKTVPVHSNEAMDRWKKKFPAWRDGGPSHDEIHCAGLLRFNNAYKFNEENELFESIKEVFIVGTFA